MSTDFAAEIASYYEAKTSYTALLTEAIAKPRPYATHPRNENIRGRSDDRAWGKIQLQEETAFEAASSADYEAIVEMQAAARKDQALKGKSGGKKKK